MLDFERDILRKVGRDISSQFSALRAEAHKQEPQNPHKFMVGYLAGRVRWLHDQLVAEIDPAVPLLLAEENARHDMNADAGTFC